MEAGLRVDIWRRVLVAADRHAQVGNEEIPVVLVRVVGVGAFLAGVDAVSEVGNVNVGTRGCSVVLWAFVELIDAYK